MAPSITFDNQQTDEASKELACRNTIIKAIAPLIANRLAVAQLRDKLRYAQIRSGAYLLLICKYSVGDYVYVRRPNPVNTLQMHAQQLIVPITKVKSNGTIIVMGRCGDIKDTHVNSIAPCHLPYLDGTIDPALAIPPADLACEVCNFPDDDAHMLLCDFCNMGWHTYCLDPP